MVEHVVRTLLSHQAPSLFRTSRADHSHPRCAGKLHGGDAYAPACAMHKDHLARTGLRPLEERTIGSGVRDVDRCTLGEGGSLGQRMDLRFLAQGLLSIRAAD